MGPDRSMYETLSRDFFRQAPGPDVSGPESTTYSRSKYFDLMLACPFQVGRMNPMNDTPDTILGLYWATLKMYATEWRADSWYENVLALFVLLCIGALVLSIVVGLALRCFE
jgi:hypothetical protein